ncbi:succinate dehydrogenase assembly factor 2 [Candidatus Thiothrix anitrata]|jgi:succinate dehydrogenase flavin-adding protein (antitoxin of CptAB toxin-antitoxin module)|uniref:FAD assembly factor SdhE n=2 Tax=Candidatus Thiothrix anitrata TaxID=2823902 RepID=A0ABX7WYF8_9GAMM|nr:succinate dehydrogenase assembly factor 2 [Candidatus Thiothrix anitrata]
MNEPFQEERMVRLRWACRRTLQVLDRPLGAFLKDCHQKLNLSEQFAFERLLSAKDQDILDWIIGNRESGDAGVRAIVNQIRVHNDRITEGHPNE